MYGVKSSKFMDLFTTFGILIAIPCILAYSIFKLSYVFLLVGVAAIFVGRAIGYLLDRLQDKKN